MADNDIDPDIELDPATEQGSPEDQAEEDDGTEPIDSEAAEQDGDDSDDPDGPDDDTIEYELDDGTKVKGPKALKGYFERSRDYTQKTQTLAEQRKQFEAEQEAERQSLTALKEADQEVLTKRGQLAHIERQLKNVSRDAQGNPIAADQIDWVRWQQTNPQQAQAALQQVQALQQQKNALERSVTEAQQKHESETKQATAKRIQAALSSAEKEIPGWSQSRYEEVVSLVDAQNLGNGSAQALVNNLDTGVLKLLDLALDGHKYREARASKAKQKPKAQAENVTPIPTVSKRRSENVGPAKLSDKLSVDEWVRRRNSQLRNATG